MNILITTFSYYPAVNGIQNVSQYQAEDLVNLGHNVNLITSYVNGDEKVEEWVNGVHILRIEHCCKAGFINIGDKVGFQKLVLEYIKDADVMINICFEAYSAEWVYDLLEQVSCKKVLIVHGMHEYKLKASLSLKYWLSLINGYIVYKMKWNKIMQYDCVIHLHEKDDSILYFRRNGYFNNKVLYNAVDSHFFTTVKKQNIILNVGTFHRNKNQMRCMRVFWKANIKDYQLVLIGPKKNRYYKKLLKYKQILERIYGKRNVRILFGISREETINYYKISKIYFLSSNSEHFPVSLIEAMAAGVAYISTDVGIVRYLPGGIVCKNDRMLINNLKMLTKTWNKYGLEGFNYAKENFIQEKLTKDLENILINL